MSGCTCGPFWSVVPPEPCPIHDPERAYWRARYLDLAGKSRIVTTTDIVTYGCTCGSTIRCRLHLGNLPVTS